MGIMTSIDNINQITYDPEENISNNLYIFTALGIATLNIGTAMMISTHPSIDQHIQRLSAMIQPSTTVINADIERGDTRLLAINPR